MKPGERIRELRLAKDKTQVEFGDIIGFSDGYISEIERGVKDPSPEFLHAIEEKFHVSPATILWGLSRDHWDIIKQILQSEESSDELSKKLMSLLCLPVADHEYVPVSTLHLVYDGPGRTHEKRQPENAATRIFINNVIKILRSGNKKIVTALESNVDVILENIELKEPETKEGD